MEQLKKRVYDRETKSVKDEYSSIVCVTWEIIFPRKLEFMEGLRARPFVDNVLQCFAVIGTDIY